MIYSDCNWLVTYGILLTLSAWAAYRAKDGVLMMPRIYGTPLDVVGGILCVVGLRIALSYRNESLAAVFDFAACGFFSFWIVTSGGRKWAKAIAWIGSKFFRTKKAPTRARFYGSRTNLVKVPPNTSAEVKTSFSGYGRLQFIRVCGYAPPCVTVDQIRVGMKNLLMPDSSIDIQCFDNEEGLPLDGYFHKDEDLVLTVRNNGLEDVHMEFMAFGWIEVPA